MIRPYSRMYASVNLDAIEHNMKAMKAVLREDTGIIGVLKADGYGHGAVPVAKTIENYVAGYAVATIEEGRMLLRHGIKKPILVLGVTHESSNDELVRSGIRATIFTEKQAKALSDTAAAMGKTAYVHLAVDTGMSRIGMMPTRQSADLAFRIGRMPGICVEGIFTHFAGADERDKGSAGYQLEKFLRFDQMLKERGMTVPIRHISNSAGILDIDQAQCEAVRAGIIIYGLYPSDEVKKERITLQPAMELKSCIVYIKTIEPGTAVSYGGTFVAETSMKIATIPVGYGDGYPRNLSGKGRVLIHGKSAPILGRVCMDQMMVDISHIPEAGEDDEVTLIGCDGREQITVEELADTCGGFHYEIICDIGKRTPRVYTKNGVIVGQKDYFEDCYYDFMKN